MNHSDSCKRFTEEYRQTVTTFTLQHPDHCGACGGWGMVTTTGCSVPYGSTNVNLPDDTDPCPACVEQGRCPWCWKESLSQDDTLCLECGWEDGKSEGLPEPYECECWDDLEINPSRMLIKSITIRVHIDEPKGPEGMVIELDPIFDQIDFSNEVEKAMRAIVEKNALLKELNVSISYYDN
jgi:hypothetical protein